MTVKRLSWLGLAALIGVIMACRGGESQDVPEVQPFDPGVEATLHEIRAKVSEIRGLSPYEKVVEGTVSRETLLEYSKQQAEQMTDEERVELEAYTAALRLLRIIGPEDDLLKLFTEGYVGNILGQYLPDAKRLVLVGEGKQLSMGDKLTLAHEYAHSLQDGAFGFEALRKWEGSETDRDGHTQYNETIDCLLEGDAEVTQRLYAEQTFGADWEQQQQAEESQASEEQAPPMPEFLARAFSFTYRECKQFVQQLYEEGGWEAVNQAYARPPATTEQVLHPEKYKARELANGQQQPKNLSKKLGEGWTRLDVSQFGEFDVYNYAVTLTGEEAAASIAAAGWGGGWVTVYRSESEPSRVVVQLSLGWDSNQDLDEFLFIYGAILGSRGVSFQPASDGEPEARWTTENEYGFVSWDDVGARVDILIATDEGALRLATL